MTTRVVLEFDDDKQAEQFMTVVISDGGVDIGYQMWGCKVLLPGPERMVGADASLSYVFNLPGGRQFVVEHSQTKGGGGLEVRATEGVPVAVHPVAQNVVVVT